MSSKNDVSHIMQLSAAEKQAIAEMEAEERGETVETPAPEADAETDAAPEAKQDTTEPEAKVDAAPEPEAVTTDAPAADAPTPESVAPEPAADDIDDDEPVYLPVTDVAPLKESLTKAEADLEAIAAQLDAGDISASEAFRESNKINRQIAELQSNIHASEQAVKANQAASERYFDRSVSRFMAEPDNKALYVKDSPAWKAMDAALKTISAIPDNQSKSVPWMLREADRIARAMVNAPRKGVASPAAASASAAPAPAPKQEAKPKPTADRKQTVPVPRTLSTMPSADQEQVTSEFDYIDKMTNGTERERAIAKLTVEQRERYLSFA